MDWLIVFSACLAAHVVAMAIGYVMRGRQLGQAERLATASHDRLSRSIHGAIVAGVEEASKLQARRQHAPSDN